MCYDYVNYKTQWIVIPLFIFCLLCIVTFLSSNLHWNTMRNCPTILMFDHYIKAIFLYIIKIQYLLLIKCYNKQSNTFIGIIYLRGVTLKGYVYGDNCQREFNSCVSQYASFVIMENNACVVMFYVLCWHTITLLHRHTMGIWSV